MTSKRRFFISLIILSIVTLACSLTGQEPTDVVQVFPPSVEIGAATVNPDGTITVCPGETIALTTNARGRDLTYFWSIDGRGRLQQFQGKEVRSNRYIAPDTNGEDIVGVTLTDADNRTVSDQIIIRVVDCTTSVATIPLPTVTSVSPTASISDSIEVNITSPQNGSGVTSPVDMSFTINGEIPVGFKPVVFIRDPFGQFWPWFHVQNQGNGNWFLPGVTLGNENDCDQSFELHVVITDENVLTGPTNTPPSGISHSVTVTRQCDSTSTLPTMTAIPPVSLEVFITSPQDGSSVTPSVDMNFTTSSAVSDGFSPVVFVRDPSGRYWGWVHVQNLGNNNWFLPGITLGSEEDCGKSFELHVVITNESVPVGQPTNLPNGVSHSVTVIKQCEESSLSAQTHTPVHTRVPVHTPTITRTPIPTHTPTSIPAPTPTNTPVPLSVNITTPQNGSSVTSPVDMSFTVSGNIPEGFRPVVFVRDPLGQLWPWFHVQNQGSGKWFLPGVTLGNENDCGKSFELHVVITDEDVQLGPTSTLPNGPKHFVSIIRTC